MIDNIRNIVAVVAVLAVALLGALALANRAQDRDDAMRQSIVTLCEKTNVGRGTINQALEVINTNLHGLQDALAIAQRERNQRTADRIEYARIQASLGRSQDLVPLAIPDCEDDILGKADDK